MASRMVFRSRKRRKSVSVSRRRFISAERRSVADYMIDKARDIFNIGVLSENSLSENEELNGENWVVSNP